MDGNVTFSPFMVTHIDSARVLSLIRCVSVGMFSYIGCNLVSTDLRILFKKEVYNFGDPRGGCRSPGPPKTAPLPRVRPSLSSPAPPTKPFFWVSPPQLGCRCRGRLSSSEDRIVQKVTWVSSLHSSFPKRVLRRCPKWKRCWFCAPRPWRRAPICPPPLFLLGAQQPD